MKINSEQEMLDYGASFAATISLPAVIELIGDVGAGKTTLVRGLAHGLGIKSPVASPSYTISRSYAFTIDGNPRILDHYDFYRLNGPGLMSDTLAESIHSGHLVVVEWADTIQDVLPEDRITIIIKLNDDGTREITLKDNHSNAKNQLVKETKPKKLTDKPKTTFNPDTKNIHLYLDTSTPTTILRLNDTEYTWESRNNLAEQLLEFIHNKLREHHADWHDISEITFMSGPGSFTGLRIGAAIVNTLARDLDIPLYDHHGTRHQVILPDYGRPANITAPKK